MQSKKPYVSAILAREHQDLYRQPISVLLQYYCRWREEHKEEFPVRYLRTVRSEVIRLQFVCN